MNDLGIMLKRCFKCFEEKPNYEFYFHKKMADQRLGKCKECTRRDSRARYASPEGRKKIALYEKMRSKTDSRKLSVIKYQKQSRLRNHQKYKARTDVSNAIRDGRLIKLPCIYCSNPKSEAHHSDYSDPLNVIWCCFKCHRSIEHGQLVN